MTAKKIVTLDKAPLTESRTLQGLAVSTAVSVIFLLATYFGSADQLDSEKITASIYVLANLVGVAWSGWNRAYGRNPPLTDASVAATKAKMKEEAK